MYIFLVFFFYQITDIVLDTVLGLGDTILKKKLVRPSCGAYSLAGKDYINYLK